MTYCACEGVVVINKEKRLGGVLAACVLMAREERDMYIYH